MKALLEENTLGREEVVPVINREIDRAPSRPGA